MAVSLPNTTRLGLHIKSDLVSALTLERQQVWHKGKGQHLLLCRGQRPRQMLPDTVSAERISVHT
jgi:hypothetical protein